MKVLIVLVLLVAVALVVFLIIRAIVRSGTKKLPTKWIPDTKALGPGRTAVFVHREGVEIQVDEIEGDLSDLENNAEFNIAWDSAKFLARKMNKDR